MKSNALLSVIVVMTFLLFGCKERGHTPKTPSIDCEVVSGPNKGKKGKRTENGFCEGDWGATECDPPSKCKDIPAEITTDAVSKDPLEEGNDKVQPGGTAVVGIVPTCGSAAIEYCQRNNGNLSVFFRNTGDGPSSDQTIEVKVEFQTGSPNASVSQFMPSIAPGETIEMIFEIPGGCFSPDCDFTIQWSNQPAVQGKCIG